MKRRIAILALTLAFLAAPGLAAVSPASCPSACPEMAGDMGDMASEPCPMGDAPCASLAARSCCEAAPAAPASQPHQTVDTPSLHLAGTALCPSEDSDDRGDPPPGRDGNLALLTSPLRLSVVLLI